MKRKKKLMWIDDKENESEGGKKKRRISFSFASSLCVGGRADLQGKRKLQTRKEQKWRTLAP